MYILPLTSPLNTDTVALKDCPARVLETKHQIVAQ